MASVGTQVRSAAGKLRGYAAFWLNAFAQPTIDLTLRTHEGLSTRIVESPGRALSEDDLERLVAQLRVVAGKTLPAGDLTYGIFSGDREGLSWVLYGLTTLVLFIRGGLRQKWISNVTQVPAVCGMVCETFSDVFPSPQSSARATFAHLQLARGIMRRHRAVFGVGEEAGFDESRFVITDAYTGGSDALKKTFDVAPKHRDEQYNAFCARELDYARGDDLLQVGRVDLAAARRYLLSEVPAGSMPALLATSALLALQRLVLPAMHWMDDNSAFGILRPRGGER